MDEPFAQPSQPLPKPSLAAKLSVPLIFLFCGGLGALYLLNSRSGRDARSPDFNKETPAIEQNLQSVSNTTTAASQESITTLQQLGLVVRRLNDQAILTYKACEDGPHKTFEVASQSDLPMPVFMDLMASNYGHHASSYAKVWQKYDSTLGRCRPSSTATAFYLALPLLTMSFCDACSAADLAAYRNNYNTFLPFKKSLLENHSKLISIAEDFNKRSQASLGETRVERRSLSKQPAAPLIYSDLEQNLDRYFLSLFKFRTTFLNDLIAAEVGTLPPDDLDAVFEESLLQYVQFRLQLERQLAGRASLRSAEHARLWLSLSCISDVSQYLAGRIKGDEWRDLAKSCKKLEQDYAELMKN
jgi:hypothetical protein